MAADTCQRLEPFGFMVFKAAALIYDHHIERPCIPVIVHQPADVFPVDDIKVRRGVQCPDPFRLAPQYGGHPEDLRVVPFVLFFRPGAFCNLLRRDYKDFADGEPVIFQLPDSRQGGNCFPKSLTHIQKQS